MNTDKPLECFRGEAATIVTERTTRLKAFICVHLCSSVFLGLLLASCTVGPNYSKPQVETPPAYKQSGDWLVAQPKDDVPKGKWWEIYGDPVLNGLEEQVEVSNQTLVAAEARYRQAQAATKAARSALFPTIGATGSATRSGRGSGSTSGNGASGGGGSGTTYSVLLDARWEADIWGRIHRQIEATRATEEATAADLEAARLSLQAELATDYVLLRVADSQRELIEDSVKAFRTSLTIAQNRYRAGVAAKVDVVLAESQVKTNEAQAIDLRITRAQLEHAIAVLAGKAPAGFAIEPVKFGMVGPLVPPGVPSTLLERRPDIAAAERRMAAANAQVGVAQAAYYPDLTLSGSVGFAGTQLSNLISAPNRVWSLGLDLAGTLLDFGARSAAVESSRAAYDAAVADYRGTVLGAFQEVENSLVSARWLGEELQVQQDAASLARENVTLTLNQYKAGTVGYLNVALAQAQQLSNERDLVNLQGRQIGASIALIRALGGSW
jgi:NodT family efflux transporter outer membrane factor (OMF) lipoprotein